MGKAMMGTGEATGDDRALMAAQNAIANPLLDEVSLKGAKAVLVNVTGGLDMTLLEVDEAANAISEQVDSEANIIFGAAFDPSLDGVIRVSVVATGMDGASIAAIEPKVERTVAARSAPEPVRHPAPEPARAPLGAYQARPAPVQPTYTPTTSYAPEPQAYAPAPQPYSAAPAYAPTPAPRIEPAAPVAEPAAAARFEEQADLYAAPAAKAPEPAAEPQIVRPASRIVDPAVSEEQDEPLFGDAGFDDRRQQPQQRGGFLSLFGARPRYEPAPQASGRGGALPMETPIEADATDAGEDLEIPSFLRRLAN
jgi:cell division protein FtsZ